MKLVASPGKSSEPHTFKAMVGFEVSKAHLNPLALITGLEKTFRAHQSACQIACILMNVTRNLPRRSLGTTLRLERTDVAVELGGAIAECVAIIHGACGLEDLIVRTDVDASPLVPAKIAAREGTVIALAGIADRDMGRDPAANQPTEEAARPISCVSGQPLRL
jgi:hypothetical protein